MRSHLIAIGAVILLASSCSGGADATRSTTFTEAGTATITASTLTLLTTVSSTTTRELPITASTTTTAPTTTRPIDEAPPLLEVTAPEEGATLTSSAVRFEGVTEPGATVVAWDRWIADVANDGTWHLVLTLNPGSNIARFTATDPAGNTTTVESVVRYAPTTTTTTPPGTVTRTTVINYMPTTIPDQHYEGYCVAGSHLTDRLGAWRCWRTDEEGGIYDPCFDTGSEVVCGASPINDNPGFVLDLTETLPQDRVPGDPKPWILELIDGTYCFGVSGAVGSQLGVRVHYQCDDGSFVLEDVRSGEVWTGHRLIMTEPPDREVAGDLGWVSIRTIWQ